MPEPLIPSKATNAARGFLNDDKNSDKPASQQFDAFYKPANRNWYTARPYGFRFTPRKGKPITMFLPISPQNLKITTHYATNVVTTLYGVIEEHSEVRYYDIVISGTTGYAPSWPNPVDQDAITPPRNRESFSDTSFLPDTGGFFQQTAGVINQVADKINNIVNGNINETGIDPQVSGYIAFHNLYRFFLTYKKDASGEVFKTSGSGGNTRSELNKNKGIISKAAGGGSGGKPARGHPLTFFNYKDENKYDVVPLTFDLIRSAESPMLYNYSLKLRAYNLQPVSKTTPSDLDFLSKMGLVDEKGKPINSQSAFGAMGKLAGTAMGVIGGIASGASILGG